jgi:hypothetical protein
MYTKLKASQLAIFLEKQMIIEMRTYTLKAGTAATYLKLYEEKGLEVHRRTLGNLIGYFSTEVGDINQVVHLWGYDTFEDRQRRRAELVKNETWQEFLKRAFPYFVSQETKLLNGTSFSPIR